MGVRFAVELRVVSEVLAPMAFGLVRPVVVFPLALLLRLPQDEVDAVLLHELAHLRRRDPWINAAQIAIESLFFFNPAMLWISRQIRADRELCCDALVLTTIVHRLVVLTTGRLSNTPHGGDSPHRAAGRTSVPSCCRCSRLMRIDRTSGTTFFLWSEVQRRR